jgi:hypothetical protein
LLGSYLLRNVELSGLVRKARKSSHDDNFLRGDAIINQVGIGICRNPAA